MRPSAISIDHAYPVLQISLARGIAGRRRAAHRQFLFQGF